MAELPLKVTLVSVGLLLRCESRRRSAELPLKVTLVSVELL